MMTPLKPVVDPANISTPENVCRYFDAGISLQNGAVNVLLFTAVDDMPKTSREYRQILPSLRTNRLINNEMGKLNYQIQHRTLMLFHGPKDGLQ